jgi:hypothetical protein
MRIEKLSIFKSPDGFKSMPLKDSRKLTGDAPQRPLSTNAKQTGPYDLLESRPPTQDSTETFPLSARNRVRTRTSFPAMLQLWSTAPIPANPICFEGWNGRL